MRKEFIKPEIRKMELNLEESIAASGEPWAEWIANRYLAWFDYQGCNYYISGPDGFHQTQNTNTLNKDLYDARTYGWHTQWATVLNNCELGVAPPTTVTSDPNVGVQYLQWRSDEY